MADQYSVKIGDGPSWQISADEYADLVRHKSLVDGLQNELKAAQATIRSLTAVVEQAEAHVEDRDRRLYEQGVEVIALRADNARLSDEVARLNATIVRLTNGGSIDG